MIMGVHSSANKSLPESSFISSMLAPNGVCSRASAALRVIAADGIGLGEVLRDYAQQGGRQLVALLEACGKLAEAEVDAGTAETLKNAHYVLSTVATVLEMTPSAMLRNKADTLGDQDKWAREDVVRLARAFRFAPELQELLASEESCLQCVEQVLGDFPCRSGQSSLEGARSHC